jgi:formylglycine-generating enzyme required for sulfatase activity
MSPEQAQTGSVISPATDVWPLGLIAFWMLTGVPFWKGAQEEHPNPMKLMLEVCFEALPTAAQRAAEFGVGNLLPEGFDGWFGKCVVRDPAERFTNARQARLGLEALLSAPSGSAFGSGAYPAINSSSGAYAPIGGGPPSGPASGRTLAARGDVSGVTALSGLSSPNEVPDLPDFDAPKSPAPVARKEGARIVSAPTQGSGTGIASPLPASRPQPSQPQQQGLSSRDREVLASINRERKAPTASATTTAVSTTTRAAYANASKNELPIAKVAIVVAVLIGAGFGALKIFGGHKPGDGSKVDADPARDNATVPTASAKPAPPTCPATMAMIPGGSFQNSSATITVDPFCIDKTEVTASAYAACVKSGKCKPAHAAGNWAATADQMPTRNQACNAGRADRAEHPINCVEWSQAVAYCDAQGSKLPTDVQWEWAARGARLRTTYPWGNTAPTAGQMCWSGDLKRTSTCPVGKHERGHNPFGVADFEGNVREWTSTTSSDTQAILCGSDWTDTDAEQIHLSGYCGTAAKTDDSSFVGFRCVKGS